jgi:hypothetical protein
MGRIWQDAQGAACLGCVNLSRSRDRLISWTIKRFKQSPPP